MKFMLYNKPAQKTISRPIELIEDKGFSLVKFEGKSDDGHIQQIDFLFDESFSLKFASHELDDHLPIDSSNILVSPQNKAQETKSWLSVEAYTKYVVEKQELETTKAIFEKVVGSVDRFVSFDNTLGSQSELTEFTSCWIMSTYATNIFPTAGYFWCSGEKGSGKSQCLKVISSLSFMGMLTTSSSTFASIRDSVEAGATICFDDCENLKGMDPRLRELLLSANSKGTELLVKTQGKRDNDWDIRRVNVFAHRAFSAIGLPDPTLESRSIMIGFVPSDDPERTRRKPSVQADWDIAPGELRDLIWLQTVKNLNQIANSRQLVSTKVSAFGRAYDIFEGSLTIAYWLQEFCGVEGVFDRMLNLFEKYQTQKAESILPSEPEIPLGALGGLLDDRRREYLTLTTAEIVSVFHQQRENQDVTDSTYLSVDKQRIGSMLGRMDFSKSASHGKARSWKVSRNSIEKAAQQFGIRLKPRSITQQDEDEIEVEAKLVRTPELVVPW